MKPSKILKQLFSKKRKIKLQINQVYKLKGANVKARIKIIRKGTVEYFYISNFSSVKDANYKLSKKEFKNAFEYVSD